MASPVKYKITAHRLWHVANKGCHSTVCKSALLLRATIAEGSMSWGGTIQWAIPVYTPNGWQCSLPTVGKTFGLTGEGVVYRGLWVLQRRRYPSMSLSPGTDTEKPWDSTMEPFVLPKQLILLLVGKVWLWCIVDTILLTVVFKSHSLACDA